MKRIESPGFLNLKSEVEALFSLCGFHIVDIWELVNPYWPRVAHYDEVRTSWWLVKTDEGLIEIGWRKRVISINWKHTDIRTIVTDEDLTKGPDHVHAYSLEKAVEYLRTLKSRVA